jgi:hypothetical protein
VTGTATSGPELWIAIVREAGLEVETPYDAGVADDVAKQLDLPPGKGMPARIAAKGSSTTDVLVAVLNALQPWALMMRDLLMMMRSCGAQKTQTQLRADVDIADASRRLEFELDLEHFTEALEAYETFRRVASARLWSTEALANLWNLTPRNLPGIELPDGIRRWLEAYEPEQSGYPVPNVQWPPPPDPRPHSGHKELDSALNSAYQGWLAALDRVRAVSTTRLELYQLNHESGSPLQEDVSALAAMDHDRWAGAILRGLHELANHVASGGWDWPDWAGTRSPQDLIDFVAGLRMDDVVEEELESLRHLLSLPVWRKRYEVYANWVFTQIVAALSETGLDVEAPRGRIDFGFKATRMAAVSCADSPLSVYSELRSPLRGPSVKRRRDAQPDYSVLVGDPGDVAHTSVVEVECKQYRRASPANFGAVLHDYTLARPEALVVLTNYGPISERTRASIMDKVDPALHRRCHMLGNFRPQQQPILDNFRHTLRDVVQARAPELFAPRVDVTQSGVIELRWAEASTADLDLHLAIEVDGSSTTVNYQNPNERRGHPFAWLIADITEGPGPEVLEIGRWLPVTYRLSVHDFRGGDLSNSSPAVTIKSCSGSIRYECPRTQGTWWDVVQIDGATGEVTELAHRRH